jgi:hypothetical protein
VWVKTNASQQQTSQHHPQQQSTKNTASNKNNKFSHQQKQATILAQDVKFMIGDAIMNFTSPTNSKKKQNKPLHLPVCLAAVAVVLPWLAWPLAVVARHFFCFVVGTMLSDIT